MISPTLLIAEREFRTYVMTLSFWLSLAIVPLAGSATLFWGGGHPAPVPVSIEAGNPGLRQSARAALAEAGRLEGKSFVFGERGEKFVLSQRDGLTIDMTIADGFPLSPMGRALVAHLVERDEARRFARTSPLVVEKPNTPSGAPAGADAAALSRFAAMMMLWLIMTGSLGMLLQAVVRERANRALESLLAAARPWQIVAGKILGVGAVSLLVLATWLGSILVLSCVQPAAGGLVPTILANIAKPHALAWDAAIYVCAFAFYGAVTVAVGAMARDSAAAQNAARPLFVLLLAAFLVALFRVGKSSATAWIYFPPFTPFLLLMNSSDRVAFMPQALLLGFLLLTALITSLMAARLLSAAPTAYKIGSNVPRKAHHLG